MAERRKVRQWARRYVVEVLRGSDMPGWPYDVGLINPGDMDAEGEFMEELLRIATRVERTLNDGGRAALRSPADTEETR